MNDRPVVVITGATSGVGRATAVGLAGGGACLHILGRNRKAGESLVKGINRRNGPHTARFHRVDLGEWDSVRLVVESITNTVEAIDCLILAAGARNDTRLTNSAGVEMTFAANHLGHFLLTSLLLDRLFAAPAARVIALSSGSHYSVKDEPIDWNPIDQPYDRRQAYARSKLANVLFAYELSRRGSETGLVANAYDPGGVISGFARNNGLKSWLRHIVAHLLHGGISTPKSAARGLIRLALDPEFAKITGRYFHRLEERQSSPLSYNSDLAQQLWELSLELTKLSVDRRSNMEDRAF